MFFMTESLDSNINLNIKTANKITEKPEIINQEQQNQLRKKEKTRRPSKYSRLKQIFIAAFVGFGLAACQRELSAAERREIETLGDTSPMVQQGYDTYSRQRAENNYGSMSETVQGIGDHEAFEVPATDQTIRPGSRVQVLETGGYGLNIRSEAGINSDLVTNVPDGTVFKVIELIGEKDGYHWVLVKSEVQEGQREIVGYAVTDWFQVLRNEPVR
jgi:hypothetical protein